MRILLIVLLAALGAGCGASKQEASASRPAPHSTMGEDEEADAPAGPSLCGRVELAPALAASFKPGTILYVFAKPQPGGGPPTAVRRYAPDGFPFPFCLSQKNTMVAGLKFEGKVYVTARVDVDGSGVISTAGDLEGFTKTPVDVGATDIVLTIDTTK